MEFKKKTIKWKNKKMEQFEKTKNAEEIYRPLHNDGVEQTILGAILIDGKAFEKVIDFLEPEYFFDSVNQTVYKAFAELYKKKGKIDLVLASQDLQRIGKLAEIGGDYYLISLTQKVASGAHIEEHSHVLYDLYLRRELTKINQNFQTQIQNINTSANDLYDSFNKSAEALVSQKTFGQQFDFYDTAEAVIKKAERLYKGVITPGIPTHLKSINNAIGGFKPTQFVILAARPSMGKTALALQLAQHASNLGYKSAFLSLETSAEALIARLLSQNTGISSERINNKGITAEEKWQLSQANVNMSKNPIEIIDESYMTVSKLRQIAKYLKRNKGLHILFIDFLQLTKSENKRNQNANQDLTEISRDLKILAKELKITIIALSQLSRACELRQNKRPILSDLRDSGAIEQDADIVFTIYRHEYYNNQVWDEYGGESCLNQAEIIILKNKDGRLMRNRFTFEKQFLKFSELEQDHFI